MGYFLGTVPWDTSLFLVIVVHDELEAALHCRLGKPRPIGDVSDALPLPAQSFERINPDGCTEAIFAAHNIPAEIVAKLLRKGLATAGADRVGRLWITERGRRELIGW
jgi:hypothetical protein